jgi:nucleoside-diphosphate-sugar epimerase
MKIANALVTGGAGFIGSHIVDELIKKGIRTFVIDDLSTGSMNNLAQHKNNELLHVYIGDIKDVDKILNYHNNSIDIVFHEAANVSVPKSVSNPMLVHDTNVNATLNLLNFCIKNNVKKFIFASSAAVYGSIESKYLSEEYMCMPSSPYGASKLSIENYLYAYNKTYGLDSIILRYFNVLGPRQKYDSNYSGVITSFINKLLNKEKPTIFGNGNQTRDFVHVKDVAKANILAMEFNNATDTEKIFNISSGNATSIMEIFDMLKELTDTQNILPYLATQRAGDILYSIASIDKAKTILRYFPKTALLEGLAETVNYFKHKKEYDTNASINNLEVYSKI